MKRHFYTDRWHQLLKDSEERKATLLKLQVHYGQIDDLNLTFARRASAFNSWFENAQEDLNDLIICNSIDEIKVRPQSS